MVALSAYFERIGHRGSTTPTLDTLRALCLAHVRSVPFENLDVLLGRGISLEEAAVDAKLIDARRGGYCFEQNTLFLRVLLELGFTARPISARVRVGRPRDYTPARTHVFVRLELEGESWLADVGVGGLSPTAPLRLIENLEQETPHEKRRLLREDGKWFHQAWLGEAWADVCEFTLEEMPPIDREVANWFTSAHPQSHFRNRLLVARALDDGGRVTLLNRELTVRTRSGPTSTMLKTPDELLAVLDQHFGLKFPSGTRFDCSALDWPVTGP
jgi:N-hydroxyarylamine O-acetyltransferase